MSAVDAVVARISSASMDSDYKRDWSQEILFICSSLRFVAMLNVSNHVNAIKPVLASFPLAIVSSKKQHTQRQQ
jgi:hypothetical protein